MNSYEAVNRYFPHILLARLQKFAPSIFLLRTTLGLNIKYISFCYSTFIKTIYPYIVAFA